jgi:hypothetical protein
MKDKQPNKKLNRIEQLIESLIVTVELVDCGYVPCFSSISTYLWLPLGFFSQSHHKVTKTDTNNLVFFFFWMNQKFYITKLKKTTLQKSVWKLEPNKKKNKPLLRRAATTKQSQPIATYSSNSHSKNQTKKTTKLQHLATNHNKNNLVLFCSPTSISLFIMKKYHFLLKEREKNLWWHYVIDDYIHKKRRFGDQGQETTFKMVVKCTLRQPNIKLSSFFFLKIFSSSSS